MNMDFFLLDKQGRTDTFEFPRVNGQLRLKQSIGLSFSYVQDDEWTPFPVGMPLELPLPYKGLIQLKSEYGKSEAFLEHTDAEGKVIEEILITANTPQIRLQIDSNRDGEIGSTDITEECWVWGKFQMGAIALVNNDKDLSDFENETSKSEFTKLTFLPTYLSELINRSIVLYASENAARRFRIYGKNKGSKNYEVIIGADGECIVTVSRPLNLAGEDLYLEAIEFPNNYFEGLTTLEIGVLDDNTFRQVHKLVFRTAPWIMTPNTLDPIKVFTCRITDTNQEPNDKFIEGLSAALAELNIPLKIIEDGINGNDRWIQDEIEFGYCQSPTHVLPVVFDSPRDRALDGFPEAELLGPDFGHFQVGGSTPDSLDSFGNLEVSPPVMVKGRNYPFGRIIFGGKKYGDYGAFNRQMMPEIRSFLYSQKVQSPVEIYSDWLAVGHVDEIISFVPASNKIGFKLLIASPRRAKSTLEVLASQGHGSVKMFEGKKRYDGSDAEISIADLLSDVAFWKENEVFQRYQDDNKLILMEELNLSDKEIIQIPVLFQSRSRGRTLAYFPDMVNHLVIGMNSIVPKPYGPIINGKCAFENEFEQALLDRKVYFIDDWSSYHELSGEVHCGTNVQRKPFENIKWWEYKPDGAYDI